MSESDEGQTGPRPDGPIGSEEQAAPQLRIVAQYIKDLSFENPNSPRLLSANGGQPEIGVHVDVRANKMADGNFEIELRLTVDAKTNNEVMFMVDLQYAGIFLLQNIPEESVQPVLMIEAPRQIFPFARRIVADITRDGGFPPLMIDPIDFAGLYRRRLEQAQQEQAEAGGLNA